VELGWVLECAAAVLIGCAANYTQGCRKLQLYVLSVRGRRECETAVLPVLHCRVHMMGLLTQTAFVWCVLTWLW
jgi:hypothetical protein